MIIPDLGRELARWLGVPCELVRVKNPAGMIAAFRTGAPSRGMGASAKGLVAASD